METSKLQSILAPARAAPSETVLKAALDEVEAAFESTNRRVKSLVDQLATFYEEQVEYKDHRLSDFARRVDSLDAQLRTFYDAQKSTAGLSIATPVRSETAKPS